MDVWIENIHNYFGIVEIKFNMNIQHYNTRIELLNMISKDSIISEIGVFKGEFSQSILEICNPSILFLVDIWQGGYGSGDKDGNNHVHIPDMEEIYLGLAQKYATHPSVNLVRSTSMAFLKSSPSEFLDVVYIDGDHSEIAVYNDLVSSFRVIKDGGLLMGHDYHYTTGGEVEIGRAHV